MYGQAVAPALETHLYHSLAQHLVVAAPVLLQQHGQRQYQQGRLMEWTHSGRLPYQRQLGSHTSGPDVCVCVCVCVYQNIHVRDTFMHTFGSALRII